jgi:hypothetical protein
MIGWFGVDHKPLTMLWSVPQGFFLPEKIASLEMVDTYVVMFHVFS